MYTHIIVVIHITHYNKNHLQGLTGRSLMTMIFHYTLSTQKFLKKCFFFPLPQYWGLNLWPIHTSQTLLLSYIPI